MTMEQSKDFIIDLPDSLGVWGSPNFEDVFKNEISHLGNSKLPLQQFLSRGNYACEDDIKVILLSRVKDGSMLRVKAGIFFNSMIVGCSCADDPSPVDKLTEYCELEFEIDRKTARACVKQLS